MTTRPVLANNGAMSQFIGAFEVTSSSAAANLTAASRTCGMASPTRHADTIDTKFFLDGEALVIGLAHPAFVKFRERTSRDLTDREASYISAEYLRERLEEDDERLLYDVSEGEVLRLIDKLGIK